MSGKRPLLFGLYGVLASATAPAILAWRAIRGKEDLSRIAERRGRPSLPRGEGPLVWMHGASVGEGLSLLPLVSQLRDLRPDIQILVTTGTRASAEMLATRLPAGVVHQFAPVDTPAATARFVSHWRPSIGIFVESELWPTLVKAARASGVRLALVSAKISDRSWRNWRRFPRHALAVFSAFDLILARDPQARTRIEDIGGRVDGLWDAKLGAAPLAVDEQELARMRSQAEDLAVIVAASTHPGEEVSIARAFGAVAGGAPQARLIVVPRHANRGGEVERIVRGEGLTAVRRSQDASLAAAQVYIADTMGELGLWYRLAGLAIVGGSLADGVGGHNPLEPARLGCPFVSGPYVDHWPIYGAFVEAQATRLVNAADDLTDLLRQALEGSTDLPEMADRAQTLAGQLDAGSGALAPRLLDLMAR